MDLRKPLKAIRRFVFLMQYRITMRSAERMGLVGSDNRIASAPSILVEQNMQCSDYPKQNSPAWSMHRPFFERLERYDLEVGSAVDDIYDVIEWLREGKNYEQSDRLRVVAGRLARSRRRSASEGATLIRTIARGW